MSTINDGAGTGLKAKVGSKNRLHTHSLAAGVSSVATQDGAVFNVSTESLTLTTANASALLYIENTEDSDISITHEFINAGNSAGGSGVSSISFFLNPTGGTLISDATAAQVVNRHLGDSATVSLNAYKGAEGKTVTGGDEIVIHGNEHTIAAEFVLSKGASFAIQYTPPPGNTSQAISIGAIVIKNYANYTTD